MLYCCSLRPYLHLSTRAPFGRRINLGSSPDMSSRRSNLVQYTRLLSLRSIFYASLVTGRTTRDLSWPL